MKKMYANDKPGDWHTGCGVVPDKDENFSYECYLLDPSELEQFAKECFEAGQDLGEGWESVGEFTYPTFADFWQKFKEK